MITRRQMMASGTMLAALSAQSCSRPAPRSAPPPDGHLAFVDTTKGPVTLTARPRSFHIAGFPAPVDAWLYADTAFPVLRMKRGRMAHIVFENALPQHSSIHWHGVRVPNAMDGVPDLTQSAVLPGGRFAYSFAPPDSGTYFFHPHCNTAEQVGRGLLGALIVDEDEPPAFHDDVLVVLKDWRLNRDGQFLPFVTPSGASRGGTFGAVRSANARVAPHIATRAGSDIRLRLLNADSSRISEIGIANAEAHVIAVDGNPVTPFALTTWRLGPAMRLDLSVRTGARDISIVDYFAAEPVVLATLAPILSAGNRNSAGPIALTKPFYRTPDLAQAWRHSVLLDQSAAPTVYGDVAPIILPDGRKIEIADTLCLAGSTYWTIDGASWPERRHGRLPPPLFSVPRGTTVALDFYNATSRAHPIHIHGHTMDVLTTSLLKRPPHRADTVLVLPNETVKVAFVADNPGNWMIHCHVIEHQETGMMGWFRVS
jgi:FtsP/CotA-like multicopper oxidase with cupredoxin domain